MRRSEKETVSLWQSESVRFLPQSPLDGHIKADVCVVGAGIAGLTAALLLQNEGRDVAVVDAWGIMGGETGRTTAHLVSVLDDRFYNLEKAFGKENTRLAAQSHRTAIDKIESLVKTHNIACDFERLDGYLAALPPVQEDGLKKEAAACERAGLEHEFLPSVPLAGITAGPALRFPRQATFNIAWYMQGLMKAFLEHGGRIYTGSRITGIKGGAGSYAETSEGYRVNAGAIVMATNTPVNDWVKMHTKQAAYRTYVVAFRIPQNSYPSFLLWDMLDPYHYARIVKGGNEDFLVVGGEDHKTGQANDADARYERLVAWSQEHFSVLGPVAFRWSGQVMEPVDHLAFIGRNPMDENIYIATGDSGNGMTHGTIAGMLITDLIQGRENPWEKLYDPARKTLQTAPTYLKENANFVGCMVSDWVKPGEVDKIEMIKNGEGAIMRDGISKVAVYRDNEGHLHKCSAACTHLGCVIQWNSGEKSWDCPCHGSRFDTNGAILNGPAIKPLEELFDVPGYEAGQRDQPLPYLNYPER